MTLESLMTSDVDAVFVQADDFAVAAEYHLGDGLGAAKSGDVLFIRDAMEGTREVQGDGRVLNQEKGHRLRESAIIDCKSDWPVVVYNGHGKTVSFFKISAVRWMVKRIISQDEDMISVLVTSSVDQVINKPDVRG
jgi:hypothetical protein